MRLDEINNYPVLVFPANDQSAIRRDPRAIRKSAVLKKTPEWAKKAAQRKKNSTGQNRYKSYSSFIDWLGQESWKDRGQYRQPVNPRLNLGGKVRWY